MTAKKLWAELAPSTRNKRFVAMADNHLPRTDRTVLTMAAKHSKCANRGNCTGPGCVITR